MIPVATDEPATAPGAVPPPPVPAAPPRFRAPLALLAGAGSAVLLNLANPPYDHGWLAWIAPVPLFWAVLGVGGWGRGDRVASAPVPEPNPEGPLPEHLTTSTSNALHPGPHREPPALSPRPPAPVRRAFGPGFAFGFVYLLLLAPWFGSFSPAGYVVAAVVWGVLAGLIGVLLTWLVRRNSPSWAPPVLAAAWVLMEWCRAQGPLAFPWGSLGATQYRYLTVIQVLDFCGEFGLSLLMALCATGVAAVFHGRYRRAGMRWTTVGVVLALLSAVRGTWILHQVPPSTPTARVAVIQASESRISSTVEVHSWPLYWEYEAKTAEAVAQRAELVLWPEAVTNGDPLTPAVRHHLAELLRGSQADLLAGSFVRHTASRRWMNSGVMISADGRVLGEYDKVQIVPFGEYLPARPVSQVFELLGMPKIEDLHPGARWAPVPWQRGLVGVCICFESAFGHISRRMVRQGATLLAVLTSDGWSGRATAGLQHAAFSPLRAVETRRAVARAAATGISELIDPYGRPLRSLPMFTRGWAMAELPLRSDTTIYVRFGDWPVWLSMLILLVAAFRPRPPRRGASR